jgi:large subunit ribosomal protein L22
MSARKQKKAKGAAAEGFVSKASLKNYRCSPRKARLVADLIRGKNVSKAIDVLTFCDKKTAPVLKKLLLSAVANAKERSGIDVDELFIKSVWVDAGPTARRFMPRAQGRATPIRKRSSAMTIVLDEQGV